MPILNGLYLYNMATIPTGQKFHTVPSSVVTQERGSALANSQREIYTMQDIIDTIPVMSAEAPNISHSGNQNSGKVTYQYSEPIDTSPQRVYYFKHPLLPNDEIFFVFNVEKYTGFYFDYDETLAPLTEITINNDSVLSAVNYYMGGDQYTVNFYGRYFYNIDNMFTRGNLNFPNCEYFNLLTLDSQMPSEAYFPKLKAINILQVTTAVESLNIDKLVYVGMVFFNYLNNANFQNVDAPELKVVSGDWYMNSTPIQSVSLPEVVHIGAITLNSNPSLYNFQVSSKLVMGEQSKWCDVNNTPLNQASVDGLLIAIDNGGQYNGMINLASSCESPSSAGYLAANNLINKGWSVSTN